MYIVVHWGTLQKEFHNTKFVEYYFFSLYEYLQLAISKVLQKFFV